MARSRRQRAGFLGALAQRAAQSYVKNVALPVTKYAVTQAVNRSGLAKTPEVQAAQAMFRDARSAYQSPTGQALRGQMMSMGQQMLAPQPMANPYGRSAAPAPVPMAQPVPTARVVPTAPPVSAPAPVATTTTNPQVDMLVSALIWNEANAPYRASLAKEAGRLAKDVKKSTAWNQSLQDALSALAKDVTTLVKDQGVQPGAQFFRTTTEPQPTQVIESLSMLMDPSVRMSVAQRLATHKRDPQDQRFLPGSVNQLAVAIRNEVQRVAFGGRKTRRGRKVRRATRRSL